MEKNIYAYDEEELIERGEVRNHIPCERKTKIINMTSTNHACEGEKHHYSSLCYVNCNIWHMRHNIT
jgi:hypothetical protein